MDASVVTGLFTVLGAAIGAGSTQIGALLQTRHVRRNEKREALRKLMFALQRFMRAAGRVNVHDRMHPGTLLTDELDKEAFEARVDLRLSAFLAGPDIAEEALALLSIGTGTGFTDSDMVAMSHATDALQRRIAQKYATL